VEPLAHGRGVAEVRHGQRALEPLPPLGQRPERVPGWPERADQPDLGREGAARGGPAQRRPQVVVVAQDNSPDTASRYSLDPMAGGRAGGRLASVLNEELTLTGLVAPQRLIVSQRAAATDGRVVVLDVRYRPGAARPPDHYHPEQEEQVEVLTGTLRARLHGRERALLPGDVLVVPARARHAVWNGGADGAHAVHQMLPARATETFLAQLATASAGPLGPVRAALLLLGYRRKFCLAPSAGALLRSAASWLSAIT
jgi:quercetin dioxygenase-like cupin family protein